MNFPTPLVVSGVRMLGPPSEEWFLHADPLLPSVTAPGEATSWFPTVFRGFLTTVAGEKVIEEKSLTSVLGVTRKV
jgi:hypothetical protein